MGAIMAEQLIYEIRVRGELDLAWEEYFEGLTLSHDCEGNTIFSGPIVDHTALHSTLLKIRDLNLKLISVNEIKNNNIDVSDNY
jgi:hypothetical protein